MEKTEMMKRYEAETGVVVQALTNKENQE